MSSSKRKSKREVIPGMLAPPRPKQTPIKQMSVDELHTQYNLNESTLRSMVASSSSHVSRITAQQDEIKARLAELEGLNMVHRGMKNVNLNGDNAMSVDAEEPSVSRAMLAKQKAWANWGPRSDDQRAMVSTMSMQEAMQLEAQAHAVEQERRARLEEKKEKNAMPQRHAGWTQEEYERRVWAFMNYKPTDSDLEDDDDDEDEDDDDPANFFDDDQDDGRKGQNIVEPDELEDDYWRTLISVDMSKVDYGSFYEPHDGGD